MDRADSPTGRSVIQNDKKRVEDRALLQTHDHRTRFAVMDAYGSSYGARRSPATKIGVLKPSGSTIVVVADLRAAQIAIEATREFLTCRPIA